MTNPTNPFNWQMPTASDLVTDLPADFETFGQAVATSMADLLGGTTGQVLSKASNTDMDFTWVAQDDSNAIQNAIVDAKGDLIAASAADTPARLAVGANGETLVADSSTSTGLKWSRPALNLIARTSFSNVATQNFDSVFTSTYANYLVVIDNIASATGTDDLLFKLRVGSTTISAGYYGNSIYATFNSTSVTNYNTNNQSSLALSPTTGFGTTGSGAGYFYISKVGNTAENAILNGQYFNINEAVGASFNGSINVGDTYTGFQLLSASTNITGTVSIFGLAK